MTTIANIEDRSLSRLVGDLLLFRAFSFSCFEFVSDLDIRISCFLSIYAKQTQFAAHPNERNYCTNNGLSKYQTIQTPEKQTQFQPHRPRTAQPTIKMQNKPNSPNAKMNLSPYCKKDYEKMSVREPRKNKPNQTQLATEAEIRPRRTTGGL